MAGHSTVSRIRGLVDEVIALQKLSQLGVTAHFHHFELVLRPGIKVDASDEGCLHSESPMNSRAIDAEEDAIVDAGPLRVLLSTVKAGLVFFDVQQLFERCIRVLKVLFVKHSEVILVWLF